MMYKYFILKTYKWLIIFFFYDAQVGLKIVVLYKRLNVSESSVQEDNDVVARQKCWASYCVLYLVLHTRCQITWF